MIKVTYRPQNQVGYTFTCSTLSEALATPELRQHDVFETFGAEHMSTVRCDVPLRAIIWTRTFDGSANAWLTCTPDSIDTEALMRLNHGGSEDLRSVIAEGLQDMAQRDPEHWTDVMLCNNAVRLAVEIARHDDRGVHCASLHE